MAKQDVIDSGVANVQAAEVQALKDALSAAYDQGATDQKASDGTLTQADVDAAVKAAVDPLNAQIASDAAALADSQAKAVSAVADVQSKLDAMTSKEQGEEAIVANLQSSAAALQAALDSLKSLILTAVSAPVSQPAQPAADSNQAPSS